MYIVNFKMEYVVSLVKLNLIWTRFLWLKLNYVKWAWSIQEVLMWTNYIMKSHKNIATDGNYM